MSMSVTQSFIQKPRTCTSGKMKIMPPSSAIRSTPPRPRWRVGSLALTVSANGFPAISIA